MFIFKCKMCGGTLEINESQTTAMCEYCGTKQTLPKLDDEKRANLYDRANHFRRNNEFDKAMSIYENILNEDSSDAEAYWSLVLCRYGIEYVEDPATKKRIPTVNRAQFTSIFDDDNYKSALQYADGYQKSIYEQEANAINEIQKGILAISQKEEPFDVFICYKETDNNGRRTQDSVLANELYHQLAQEGFKVFFSRITLEDKLGTAYEPYIFAALNSAKVMVVLGTRPEYFNAVWVKNEWSRYLALVKASNGKKILIPAYRDMDPYDLPEEFSHLQAQDMSKLGFMQDLIRGIKKLVQDNTPKATAKETVIVSSGNANTAPLLKRAFMYLEDSEWNSADEYCEKVLDQDPENAEAYLGKLMAEMRVRKQDALRDQAEPFDGHNNYQKALRFADDKLKTALTGYIEHINTRNENARKDGILSDAKSKMTGANILNYESAIKQFESISGWKDADEQIHNCKKKIEELKAKAEAERLERERKAEKRAKRNKKIAIITTPIVCVSIAFIIVLNTVIIPNSKYNKAVDLMNNDKHNEAIAIFEELDDYKDSKDKILESKYNHAVEQMNAGKTVKAYEALIALDGYKDSTEKANSIFGKYFTEKNGQIKKGKHITFGTYEQNNNSSDGKEDIEWLVLDKKDGKALVISKNALDCQQYNTSQSDVTWETCSLRKWLNSTFISMAFTDAEKSVIPTVTVSADKNPECSTNPGNATQDKVFLLSIPEANQYFSSDSARQCKVTAYAEAQDDYVSSFNGNCWWWLRSPSYEQDNAAIVFVDGGVDAIGYSVSNGTVAVRPALWIDIP